MCGMHTDDAHQIKATRCWIFNVVDIGGTMTMILKNEYYPSQNECENLVRNLRSLVGLESSLDHSQKNEKQILNGV